MTVKAQGCGLDPAAMFVAAQMLSDRVDGAAVVFQGFLPGLTLRAQVRLANRSMGWRMEHLRCQWIAVEPKVRAWIEEDQGRAPLLEVPTHHGRLSVGADDLFPPDPAGFRFEFLSSWMK